MHKTRSLIPAAALTMLLVAATGCGGDSDESGSTAAVDAGSAPVTASASDTAAVTAVPSGSTETTGSAAPPPPVDAASTSAAVATSAPDATAAPSAGGPVSDPCSLLPPDVAEQVLGVPVGEPTTLPGEGNSTCSYQPADGSTGFVYLTTYAVEGSQAVLDEAATQFPDAEPVDGLGDAAIVSVESQGIGVLFDDTVFALGLILQSANGEVTMVDADRLIAAGHAVLDGR